MIMTPGLANLKARARFDSPSDLVRLAQSTERGAMAAIPGRVLIFGIHPGKTGRPVASNEDTTGGCGIRRHSIADRKSIHRSGAAQVLGAILGWATAPRSVGSGPWPKPDPATVAVAASPECRTKA
jgi:hypothetical protein